VAGLVRRGLSFASRRRRLGHVHVVLYTRPGCHLCNAAWQRLRREQWRHRFSLRAVNVDEDPELAARYGLEVPVVTVDGKLRFRGLVNPALLRRLLDAEAARR
jgi:glutaredoxin